MNKQTQKSKSKRLIYIWKNVQTQGYANGNNHEIFFNHQTCKNFKGGDICCHGRGGEVVILLQIYKK